jgi:hypothetical protein
MNFAGLELCTFEGKATTMFERQCRAAASALSGFSMGLGYFWALVDEDRVGWHDRISGTHLRAFSDNSRHSLKSRSAARDLYPSIERGSIDDQLLMCALPDPSASDLKIIIAVIGISRYARDFGKLTAICQLLIALLQYPLFLST